MGYLSESTNNAKFICLNAVIPWSKITSATIISWSGYFRTPYDASRVIEINKAVELVFYFPYLSFILYGTKTDIDSSGT